MKKLLSISLLLAAQATIAAPINYELDCPNGGTRAVEGTFSSKTGNFDLTATADNCTNNNNTLTNGTITAVGTYKAIGDNKAELNVLINSDIVRQNSDTEKSSTRKCEKTVSGILDGATNYLDGSVVSSCDKSGAIYMPALELVAGLDEQEPLESKSKTTGAEPQPLMVGTWTGCSYLNTATLQIDADGKAVLITDDTNFDNGDYIEAQYCDGVVGNRRYIGTCTGPSDTHPGTESSLIDVALVDKDHDNIGVSISGNRTLTGQDSGSFTISCPVKHPSTEPVPESPYSNTVL